MLKVGAMEVHFFAMRQRQGKILEILISISRQFVYNRTADATKY